MLDTMTSSSPTAACPASTTPTTAERNVVTAIGKGLLKIISKMGISTIQSYCGAQIFEAVGLDRELVERTSPAPLADRRHRRSRCSPPEALERHARAYPARAPTTCCRSAASTRWRRDGEHHMWDPETIALLQHARRAERRRPRPTRSTPTRVNEERPRRATLRGLLEFRERRDPDRRSTRSSRRREIVKRFADRRDVARLDLAGGPRDARDRDEPPRRPLEHGRGRRGPAPLHPRPERRPAPLGDQAGRLRPLRRDDPLPRQRRPDPDQDGPGRQARRGRPAARPQGRQLHRLAAPHDARASA